MAVYQSGTEPIVRKRQLQLDMLRDGLVVQPHVQARYIRKQHKVPRKASWTTTEDGIFRTHRFEWYEVETNA